MLRVEILLAVILLAFVGGVWTGCKLNRSEVTQLEEDLATTQTALKRAKANHAAAERTIEVIELQVARWKEAASAYQEQEEQAHEEAEKLAARIRELAQHQLEDPLPNECLPAMREGVRRIKEILK